MAKTVEIPLKSPLRGHKGPITKVIVREPTFPEYVAHGDPFIWIPLPSGGVYPSESLDVIAAYMRICVVEPSDPLILEQGGLDLARKIKDAILGFFLPEFAAAAALPT